jgi:hypothetical protein
MVCKPKVMGGLGVVDLKIQNEYLLLKHLDKFHNQVDIPWVHLIREKYYTVTLPPAKRLIDPSGREIVLSSFPNSKTLLFVACTMGLQLCYWKIDGMGRL